MPPGIYRLQFTDSTATLSGTDSGKSYQIPVKITTAENTFKDTIVDSDESVKPAQLKSIDLGGSKTRLKFSKP